ILFSLGKRKNVRKMLMNHRDLANLIQRELQRGINALVQSGHLPHLWFEKHSISSPKSILHSRILGILARMNLGDGWVIDVERALKPQLKGRSQFTPDIIGWTPENRMAFVIEYESINSSDSRVEWKDISNYSKYVKNPSTDDGLPILWIIITTLKDGPVGID